MSKANLRHRKHGQKEEQESPSATLQEDETLLPDASEGTEKHDEDFRLIPLIERPTINRLDVGPFVFTYMILVSVDWENGIPRIVVTILLASTLFLHLTVVLLSQWRVPFRARVGFQKGETVWNNNNNNNDDAAAAADEWTHCLVQSAHEQLDGSTIAGIVPIQTCPGDSQTKIVNFQDRVFRYSPKEELDIKLWGKETTKETKRKTSFLPVRYPVNLPLLFYASWKGHSNLQSVIKASQVYGNNTTALKLPSFVELLGEQLLAPFFLFQIFCVVLWSLDEYWYYALFTLFALLAFESTVAYNRLNGLQRLHHVSHKNKHQRIWVRRGGLSTQGDVDTSQWMSIFVSELVPGDWVSLSGSQVPVPADILLLQGTAVCDEALLTGESIPQLKQPLDVSAIKDDSVCLDIQGSEYKESLLFGGTVLIVGTPQTTSKNSGPTPDSGIEGIVLRTGFETAQGSLLRTMAHSSKSGDSVHTMDTFVFIFILILCAVVAAGYVLHEGWHDERRNRFRLVLHVIIIVTSVVPPELPMELSLAVTNSVAALMKRCQVYCTEHFRIPWAGEVNVCCFDKTGTLTSDEMLLKGVRVFNEQSTESEGEIGDEEDERLFHPTEDEIPWPTLRVMAACHSLAMASTIGGKSRQTRQIVIGDPLEQTVLQQSGYRLMGNNIVAPPEGSTGEKSSKSISILHRFPFSSKLKRMTTLVAEGGGQGMIWALTKGAPETVKNLLAESSIPSDYDSVSMYHMSRGRRVLAMASKEAGNIRLLQSMKDNGRDAIEKGLTFVGFLVLDCPLKSDSKSIISELQKSQHDVVMITGDAIMTAAEVARQVGIVQSKAAKTKTIYKIQQRKEAKDSVTKDPLSFFEYAPLVPQGDAQQSVKLSTESIESLRKLSKCGDASFCISGDVLVEIALKSIQSEKSTFHPSTMSVFDEKSMLLSPAAQKTLMNLVPVISVFARHAPHQKEAVVAAFNNSGHQTLMCGDGTNDVGALKRAHVGISLISAPEVESKQREATKKLKSAQKRDGKERKNSKKHSKVSRQSMMEESLRQLREAQEELDQVELGDASVAAPFTSRAVSIKCCKDVIQQGRCTLVTMLQIYKILGINCLVNALVLSRLFLHGVKQGDRQLTILGLVVAALFFFVTRAEPLPTLSSTRPPASVLCAQAILSITGQSVIHLVIILATTYIGLLFVDPYDPSLVPDGPFNPNVLNSCTFLLTCLATVNTFAVNYRGRPFMQDLRENKMLYRSIQASYTVLAICALGIFPPLGDLLQMSDLPSIVDIGPEMDQKIPPFLRVVDFNVLLFILMVVDTVFAFLFERQVRLWFDGRS